MRNHQIQIKIKKMTFIRAQSQESIGSIIMCPGATRVESLSQTCRWTTYPSTMDPLATLYQFIIMLNDAGVGQTHRENSAELHRVMHRKSWAMVIGKVSTLLDISPGEPDLGNTRKTKD
uniref:Uncharacterized protein n=1 Tax=Cacopsylla melanoneura TaxID=428564 RepID=A0A8D8Z380_9HEMI